MKERERPSKEQLRDLYAAAIAFKQAEPWRNLYDTDLIAVENPLDGLVGYCSVMGRMGQHFGLCVFLGAQGLEGFFQLLELGDDEDGFADAAFSQNYIMCSFENRELLDQQDLKDIKDLGLRFRGRNAWPQFRRYEPGYHPWYLNQEEAVFLTHALEQVLAVYEEHRRGEVALDFESRRTVLRVSEKRGGELVWHTRPWKLLRPVRSYEPLIMENELLLWQLRKAPRSLRAVWELDVCYLPVVVQESKQERPRFPRGFVLADHQTGMILDCHAYEDATEDVPQVVTRLTQHIANYGLPRELRIKSDLMAAILGDLCAKTGISLKRARRLPKVEYFLEELEQGLS
ncbi:MAG TPA: hypothetical protein PLM25_02440 [Limnochordia bacterium]|nr:hypothetical protein [Limnochordia bacterium]